MTEQNTGTVTIDLRERVRVRVRPEGLRRLKRHHDRFEAMLPSTLHKPFDNFPDEAGYVEMPLTEAVSVFGADLQTGGGDLVDPVVLVVERQEDGELIEGGQGKRRFLGLLPPK